MIEKCIGHIHTDAHDKSHCAVSVHPPGLEESRNKEHQHTQFMWMFVELR